MQCARCENESPINEAFRRGNRFRNAVYCPTCWYAARVTGLRILSLVVLGFGLVGILAVALLPGSPEAWLLLHLPLLVLMIPPLILAHELGHAAVATALRLRLFSLTLGAGPILIDHDVLGCRWTIRAFPLFGLLQFGFRSRQALRLRYVLTILAGPLVNVAMIVAASPWVAPRGPRYPSSPTLMYVAFVFVTCNLLILAVNLWPRRIATDIGTIPNDGLALLTVPFLKTPAIEDMLTGYYAYEGVACRRQDRHAEARHWYERGLELYPSDATLLNNLGVAHIDAGHLSSARDYFLRLLGNPDLNLPLRGLILANLAWGDFLSERQDLLDGAVIFSDEAFRLLPWLPTAQITRAGLLIQQGRPADALPLLRKVITHCEDRKSKARATCLLALAEATEGKAQDARHILEAARALDPGCVLLTRTESRLPTIQAEKGVGKQPSAG